MLTIKQILDDKEAVIRGLEKKHFAGAAEAIEKVLEINNRRKNAQTELDALLAQVNVLSKSIGGLMKEGKKEEAEKYYKKVIDNYIVDFLETVNFIYYLKHIITFVIIFL